MSTTDPAGDQVLTVADVTFVIKELLGEAFPRLTVRGQVSNLRRQSSGHLYFSLKDDQAQLGCAMWRNAAQRLRFRPEDGQEVLATGRIDVYPPHGKYQMIVDSLSAVGIGDLARRFEELKQRLLAEGLFESERKRSLPLVPRRVAVVTSPSGAALRDFLRVATRRMPNAWITVIPARVQGDEAIEEVAQALELLPRLGDFDVAVVTRGGGSIEDLWAFNEERVARAIAACGVPVVSGVGHETDTTIADMVADARAATPSEAAELVFPDVAELAAGLTEARARIDTAVRHRLRHLRERLDGLATSRALARPVDRLHMVSQDLEQWQERALNALGTRVARARDRVGALAGHLEAVSPLSVLARGYSITTPDGARAPLIHAADVKPGDRIATRLHDGRVTSRVESVAGADGGAPRAARQETLFPVEE